jgi:hypothetical protein
MGVMHMRAVHSVRAGVQCIAHPQFDVRTHLLLLFPSFPRLPFRLSYHFPSHLTSHISLVLVLIFTHYLFSCLSIFEENGSYEAPKG